MTSAFVGLLCPRPYPREYPAARCAIAELRLVLPVEQILDPREQLVILRHVPGAEETHEHVVGEMLPAAVETGPDIGEARAEAEVGIRAPCQVGVCGAV